MKQSPWRGDPQGRAAARPGLGRGSGGHLCSREGSSAAKPPPWVMLFNTEFRSCLLKSPLHLSLPQERISLHQLPTAGKMIEADSEERFPTWVRGGDGCMPALAPWKPIRSPGQSQSTLGQLVHPPQKDLPAVTSTDHTHCPKHAASKEPTRQGLPPSALRKCCFLGV